MRSLPRPGSAKPARPRSLRPATVRRSLLPGLLCAGLLLSGLLTACLSGGPEPTHPSGPATSASSPIAIAPDGHRLWVVNPDADSVTFVPLGGPVGSLEARPPIPVGEEPWAVAVTPDGTALVMNRRGGSLSFVEVDALGSVVSVEEVPIGAEPGGVALSRDGATAYVTLSGEARVAVVDVARRRVVQEVAVGDQPWAVAVADDGTVVVTHRLARPRGEVGPANADDREAWLSLMTAGPTGWSVREAVMGDSPFGFANALEAVTTSGDRALVAHLLDSPMPPTAFNTAVSGGLTAIALGSGAPGVSLDLNDPGFSTPTSFPRALATSPDGTTVFVALTGTDAVMGVDMSGPSGPHLLGFWPTGANPRGVAVSADGTVAYVMNYLSRDVSVLSLAGARREIARVPVAAETLAADVHRGKVLFNKANDPRLSRNGWLSCASCHLDGGGDGTTWHREEGPRQTMALWSLAGTAPFHAAATRDELQDFEVDIERFMGGIGLAPGAAGPLLGSPNAGGSADLDALAAFVLHGMRPPKAPGRDLAAVARGRAVFADRGCSACHAGPAWTVSALPGEPGTLPEGAAVVEAALHDVGTFEPAHDITGSGGFDAPTLLGLAYTAPYFHDGSAATILDVLAHTGHSGPPMAPQDADALVAFLLSIDEDTVPFAR